MFNYTESTVSAGIQTYISGLIVRIPKVYNSSNPEILEKVALNQHYHVQKTQQK